MPASRHCLADDLEGLQSRPVRELTEHEQRLRQEILDQAKQNVSLLDEIDREVEWWNSLMNSEQGRKLAEDHGVVHRCLILSRRLNGQTDERIKRERQSLRKLVREIDIDFIENRAYHHTTTLRNQRQSLSAWVRELRSVRDEIQQQIDDQQDMQPGNTNLGDALATLAKELRAYADEAVTDAWFYDIRKWIPQEVSVCELQNWDRPQDDYRQFAAFLYLWENQFTADHRKLAGYVWLKIQPIIKTRLYQSFKGDPRRAQTKSDLMSRAEAKFNLKDPQAVEYLKEIITAVHTDVRQRQLLSWSSYDNAIRKSAKALEQITGFEGHGMTGNNKFSMKVEIDSRSRNHFTGKYTFQGNGYQSTVSIRGKF
jgi:hypothetical protein